MLSTVSYMSVLCQQKIPEIINGPHSKIKCPPKSEKEMKVPQISDIVNLPKKISNEIP